MKTFTPSMKSEAAYLPMRLSSIAHSMVERVVVFNKRCRATAVCSLVKHSSHVKRSAPRKPRT